MQQVPLGKSDLTSSRLIYGCMRIVGDGSAAALERGRAALRAALEAGYTHFDHADIYGGGRCEQLFGEVLRDQPGLRERLCITSKCGIRGRNRPSEGDPGRYDFSREHILRSVEGSLQRLGIEVLDVLLLHRPDYLCDPAEVAAVFDELVATGKVRHVGVSNFLPSQLSMLRQACRQPLLMNQVEINIHRIDALLDGTLDQCLQLGISPTAWCPMGGVAYPAWGNTLTAEDEQRIRDEFTRQARDGGTDAAGIMLAWLLRHPADILPIIGSTTPERIARAVDSLALEYSREQWYRLLEARNGRPVP